MSKRIRYRNSIKRARLDTKATAYARHFAILAGHSPLGAIGASHPYPKILPSARPHFDNPTGTSLNTLAAPYTLLFNNYRQPCSTIHLHSSEWTHIDAVATSKASINMIKTICSKPVANIKVNGEKLEAIPLK